MRLSRRSRSKVVGSNPAPATTFPKEIFSRRPTRAQLFMRLSRRSRSKVVGSNPAPATTFPEEIFSRRPTRAQLFMRLSRRSRSKVVGSNPAPATTFPEEIFSRRPTRAQLFICAQPQFASGDSCGQHSTLAGRPDGQCASRGANNAAGRPNLIAVVGAALSRLLRSERSRCYYAGSVDLRMTSYRRY